MVLQLHFETSRLEITLSGSSDYVLLCRQFWTYKYINSSIPFFHILQEFFCYFIIKVIRDFQPRWRHRSIHFASLHNQKKDNNKIKNKKQPEQSETRTVWKSDNQVVKEETFIQTCRRGSDRKPGCKGSAAQWRLADQAVPHLRADNPGGTTGEQDGPHNPGFQCGKSKPQNLWL